MINPWHFIPKYQQMPMTQSFLIETQMTSIYESTTDVICPNDTHICLWVSSIIVQQQINFPLHVHNPQRLSIIIFCWISTNAVKTHSNMQLLWVSGIMHLPSLWSYTTEGCHNMLWIVQFIWFLTPLFACFQPCKLSCCHLVNANS